MAELIISTHVKGQTQEGYDSVHTAVGEAVKTAPASSCAAHILPARMESI